MDDGGRLEVEGISTTSGSATKEDVDLTLGSGSVRGLCMKLSVDSVGTGEIKGTMGGDGIKGTTGETEDLAGGMKGRPEGK
jgi:hypothetical protein